MLNDKMFWKLEHLLYNELIDPISKKLEVCDTKKDLKKHIDEIKQIIFTDDNYFSVTI
jgi:hypothetical protein